MNKKQILGLVGLAVGVVLLIYACQEAETYKEQARHMMAGRHSHGVMWAYVLGTFLTIAGIATAVLFRKKGH